MNEFLSDNSIYIVFLVTLIIWIGIAVFLFKLDGKISKLEKSLEESKETDK